MAGAPFESLTALREIEGVSRPTITLAESTARQKKILRGLCEIRGVREKKFSGMKKKA
jgi:hypothetical protein